MKNLPSITLRGVLGTDAPYLFPLIYTSKVTDTILWDGPVNFEEYQTALNERQQQHLKGEIHFFTMLENKTTPIGTINIRPKNDFRADIGLWIGEKFHGKGYGTQAVKEITKYGFEKLKLQKIEATVFVGNLASRKIFENNGFVLEGTIRNAVKKRGVLVDEWLLGICS